MEYEKPSSRRHGHRRGANGKPSPTYNSWRAMLLRCQTKYRAAGIAVCEPWLVFDNFLADMGVRPEGMTLDRIDNTKGYSADNCRWATHVTQGRNRRCVRLTTTTAAQVRRLCAVGFSTSGVARAFGVTPEVVGHIKAGRTWRV